MQWCNNFTSFFKNIQSCCFVDPSFSGQCNELIRSTWPRSKTHGPLRLLQLQQPPAAAGRRYSAAAGGRGAPLQYRAQRWWRQHSRRDYTVGILIIFPKQFLLSSLSLVFMIYFWEYKIKFSFKSRVLHLVRFQEHCHAFMKCPNSLVFAHKNILHD